MPKGKRSVYLGIGNVKYVEVTQTKGINYNHWGQSSYILGLGGKKLYLWADSGAVGMKTYANEAVAKDAYKRINSLKSLKASKLW